MTDSARSHTELLSSLQKDPFFARFMRRLMLSSLLLWLLGPQFLRLANWYGEPVHAWETMLLVTLACSVIAAMLGRGLNFVYKNWLESCLPAGHYTGTVGYADSNPMRSRSSRSWLMIPEHALFQRFALFRFAWLWGAIGCYVLAFCLLYGGLNLANRMLDRQPAQIYLQAVTGKHYYKRHYYAKMGTPVSGLLQMDRTTRLRVSRQDFNRIEPGTTQAIIPVRPGLFGLPWIDHRNISFNALVPKASVTAPGRDEAAVKPAGSAPSPPE